MIDINYSLRIAYQTALSGIAGVPVFYQTVPSNISPQNYIVFRSITNNDASTVNSSDTNTTIVIEIHTWNDNLNNGLSADMVAREVFNRIYPNRQFNLTIDGAQIVQTQLSNDTTQNFSNNQNRSYISRFLTFRHNIFQRSDIS